MRQLERTERGERGMIADDREREIGDNQCNQLNKAFLCWGLRSAVGNIYSCTKRVNVLLGGFGISKPHWGWFCKSAKLVVNLKSRKVLYSPPVSSNHWSTRFSHILMYTINGNQCLSEPRKKKIKPHLHRTM